MLYSRFQSPGFRIPQAKISRIPEIGDEERAGGAGGGGGGYDVTMYTVVKEGRPLQYKNAILI